MPVERIGVEPELRPPGKAPFVHYLARLPLIFEHEEMNRRVRKVRVAVEIAGGHGHVRALFPRGGAAPGRAGGDLRFPGLPLQLPRRAGGAARKIDFGVTPRIDGLGTGSSHCAWEFTAEGDGVVRRGDRTLFLILSVPPQDPQLEVTVSAQIDVGREMLGITYDNTSEISRQNLTLVLPGAEDPAPAEELRAAARGGSSRRPVGSDFGILSLEQRGETVTGTYSCCRGTLSGRRHGDRLALSWKDPANGQGWVDFVLAACGEELRGQWGNEAPKERRARRSADGTPPGTREKRPRRARASFWQDRRQRDRERHDQWHPRCCTRMATRSAATSTPASP